MAITRSRAWCFTLNNYDEADEERIKAISCKYVIYGREVGEQGTRHLQGYIYFPNAITFAGAKSKIGTRAHIEAAKGSPSSNREYCSKSGDYEERGVLPHQGARNDLQGLRQAVTEGNTVRKILEQATSLQSVRVTEQLMKYVEPPRTTKPLVVWLHGSSGIGKTRFAFDELSKEYGADNVWISNPPNGEKRPMWFDGYDAHRGAILDDLRSEQCSLPTLLRILDRYPVRVETKGGSRQWKPDTIYITSPLHPMDQYVTSRENLQQLVRRCDRIINCDEDPRFEEEVPCTPGQDFEAQNK